MLNRTLTAALALVLFAAPACAAPDDREPPRTMTISGTGSVSAEPDMATLSAGVRTHGATAREALTANSTAMAKVMTGMETLGIAKKDIQTSNFSVYPRYETYEPKPNGGVSPPPKIVGYEVSNQVSVNVRDLTKLGEALDMFVTLGANELGGIQFGFADPLPLRDEARKEAVKDAVDTAKLLTDAASVRLGRVLTISEGGYSTPQPQVAMAMEKSRDMAVPVAAGEQAVTAYVSITYELE